MQEEKGEQQEEENLDEGRVDVHKAAQQSLVKTNEGQ